MGELESVKHQSMDEFYLVASAYGSGDPVETTDGELDALGLSLENLCRLYDRLEHIASTTRQVKQVVAEKIADELGPNCEIRLGDRLYRARETKKWRVKEVAEFCKWAGEDLKDLINVPNSVRITSIKALAEKKGWPEKAVLDTFGEWVSDGGKLSVVPVDRVAYAKKLADGQRTFPKGRQELGSQTSGTADT